MRFLYTSLLSALLLTGTAMPAWADSTNNLVFVLSDQSKITVPSEGLTMTIADNSIIAVSSVGDVTIPLSELTELYFDEGSSSVGSALLQSTQATVYSMDGQYRGSYSSLDEARQKLPKDIYIVKINISSIKTVIE